MRHQSFAQPRNRQIAFEILQKLPGIAGIKQGPESFLLFLEPEADPEHICTALEERLLGLTLNPSTMSKQSNLARRRNPYRKVILKTYLATGITTVTLATLGFYLWHKAFGWIFTAFAIDHVWVKRKTL